MPDFNNKQRRGKGPADSSSRKGENTGKKGSGSKIARAVSGGSMSDETFQRHAALLGDQRLSHPANAGQRAEIVRRIQRDYGNSYVQRLVEHVSSRPAGDIQAKLEVGAADDEFEREADRIAKEVVKNADAGNVNQADNGQVQRVEDNYNNIPPNVAQDLEDNYNNIPANIRASLEDNYNNIPADVLRDWDNNYNNIPENIRASLEDNYNNIPSAVLSALEDNYNNIPDAVQMGLPIPYANVPAQYRQADTQSDASTPAPKGISVFERLVGAMGIVVDEFNGGAWRTEFASRLQPSYLIITQMLESLGGQKSLSSEDMRVLKAVNEFAMLNLGLQAQAKGGGNASGSVSDLRKLLGLVRSSANLLDEAGSSALMRWLPDEVVSPPAEGMWGEAKKPAPPSPAQGGGEKESPYGVAIPVDKKKESQYAKTPVDPGPAYAKTPVDVGEGKMKESPYGTIIPITEEQEEERLKMGGHRAKKRN